MRQKIVVWLGGVDWRAGCSFGRRSSFVFVFVFVRVLTRKHEPWDGAFESPLIAECTQSFAMQCAALVEQASANLAVGCRPAQVHFNFRRVAAQLPSFFVTGGHS